MNKNTNTTDQQHPFSTDRPIQHREQDLLSRQGFSESIAASIINWTGKDSLVLAVYGPWGMGKTSVKNMILDTLQDKDKKSPTILEFNPWQWAGQEQIAKAFFDEIGLTLGKIDKSKEGKKRTAKWKAYSARLKMMLFFTTSARRFIYIAAGYLLTLGLIGISNSPILVQYVSWIIFFAGLTGILLGFSQKFVDHFVSILESGAVAAEKSLSDLKIDLRDTLTTLQAPLLIVIDDIDRLSKDETKLLFQLVKANADFPNIVYLLLFQRDIVEGILQDLVPNNTTGRDYLEKIVQVGFDIPAIERTLLEQVLFARLDQVLEGHGIDQLFDNHRWGNIFLGGLRHFFENLRDVNRYTSSLAFHVSLFKNSKTFEVNPVDLIVLEALRVFEPEVYRRLPDVKDELTGTAKDFGGGNETEKNIEKVLSAVVERASEEKQLYVRKLLTQLFPRTEKIGYGEGFSERWYRELRACHKDVFDRYFHFALPSGDISQSELDAILDLTSNRELLVAKFRNLKDRGLLAVALDRLEAYKREINIEHAVPFVTALFDVGDELPDEPTGFFAFGAVTHAWRIIYWYLMKETDLKKREDILMQSIGLTTGLFLPVDTVSLEDDRQERKKDPSSFLILENKLTEFIDLCITKIRSAAQSNVLEKHPRMLSILYRWRKWTSPEEPSVWVQKLIESDKGSVIFLTGLLNKSTSHGLDDYVTRVHWRINLQTIEDFVPVEAVEKKFRPLT